MPLRDYVCTDGECPGKGHKVEKLIRASDTDPVTCDICHKQMELVTEIGSTSFSLKGSGWFGSGGYALLIAAALGLAACANPGVNAEVPAARAVEPYRPGALTITDSGSVRLTGAFVPPAHLEARGESQIGIVALLFERNSHDTTGRWLLNGVPLKPEMRLTRAKDFDIVLAIFSTVDLMAIAELGDMAYVDGETLRMPTPITEQLALFAMLTLASVDPSSPEVPPNPQDL